MKTFQWYLSSINKGSIAEVLDLPVADLDHLLTKLFYRYGKTDGDRIMNLTPCRVCNGVYRGSFPNAGLPSLSFHHSKGNWWHRSSTAVNINKFSCCNTSQFLSTSSAGRFFCGHSSISGRQFKIFNGPVTIIQETQKRRRVFIESDDEE